MKKHTKDLLIGGAGWLVLILLFTFFVTATKYTIDTYSKVESLELFSINMSKRVGEQSIKIIELNDQLEEQKILNESYNRRIESNLQGINDNQARIFEIVMDVDDKSIKGLKIEINEIWDELKLIRKLVN